MTFEHVASQWVWKAIRNCPGRFLFSEGPSMLSPEALLAGHTGFEEFRVGAARDVVIVGRLSGGGLISYRREDGTYMHTLNTADGFERKLAQLGITLPLTSAGDHDRSAKSAKSH